MNTKQIVLTIVGFLLVGGLGMGAVLGLNYWQHRDANEQVVEQTPVVPMGEQADEDVKAALKAKGIEGDVVGESTLTDANTGKVAAESQVEAKKVVNDTQVSYVITATLPDLPAGEHYSAWLMKEDTGTFLLVSQMQSNGGVYEALMSMDKELAVYTRVLVSKETGDEGSVPGEVILDSAI